VRCEGEFAVGATAANAPSAIAKDTPAATHTGKAVLDRFRFEACFARAIVGPPVPASKYPGNMAEGGARVTAKALGLAIPDKLLALADEVIE
jgi:hypothetical protein